MGDYEAARRHLAAYLLEKVGHTLPEHCTTNLAVHHNLQDTSSVAHKLSGQILEQLKQPDKALACYKKAQVLYYTALLVLLLNL